METQLWEKGCKWLFMGSVVITVGLALDIVGVVVLARAVIINKETAVNLAATKWGGNKALEEALLQQSRDAKRGLVFIVSGFVLQAVGTWLDWLT